MSAVDHSATCILGPQICGKTSLLFQHAISCANLGQTVLFVSPSPLEQLPLLSSDQDKPLQSVLERIHLKYPASLSGLQELFDGIHEVRSQHAQRPQTGIPGYHGDDEGMYSCVILDDFHKYFISMLQSKSHEQTAAVTRTCAHVVDAVKYISTATKTCSCIMSMDEPTLIPGLKVDVVRRWFPSVLNITHAGEDCCYTVTQWDTKDSERQPIASYTLHQTHFEWHQKLTLH